MQSVASWRKSAPSMDSNYRAACNGRSRAEFIAKLGVVVEEADETVGWLQIMTARKLKVADLPWALDEALQLRSVYARSLGTARANNKRPRRDPPKPLKSSNPTEPNDVAGRND